MEKRYENIMKAIARILVIVGCLLPASMQLHSQSVQFYQLNFNYDSTLTNNSEWGAVDLTFIGNANVMYFNLTIDTAWVIENMPVPTTRGVGLPQTQRFWFDLGVPGVPVTSVTYGFTLTNVVSGKPTASVGASVSQDSVKIFSGFSGGPPGGGGPGPAEKQVGGQAQAPPSKHENFPNQESPTNYCVPTAISNSLQWLNTKNSLGMNAAKISIGALATGLGTTANGTPKSTIYTNKKNYCKQKKLPVTTRKAKGYQIGDVVNEIKNGQDVELCVDWIGQGGKGHCVAVTGATPLGNGKYELLITHDKEQNKTGGTVDEQATYDKNNHKWGGALSKASGQSGDILFIIECPVVKFKQTTTNLPGGNRHKFIPNCGTEYMGGQVQIHDLDISGYTNTTPLPPLGQFTYINLLSTAMMQLSFDGGNTFNPCMSMANAVIRLEHVLDSGGVSYIETELLQLDLSGGTLPPNVRIRESPTQASTGLETISIVPGGFQFSSFFDVFTELSMDGGMTWFPDENETTVLYADGPHVLDNITLENLTVQNSETVCYDAYHTITVAGGTSTFVVQSGGSATLIAGQNILFMPGTYVQTGGYLHGYITTIGEFCEDAGFPPVAWTENPQIITHAVTNERDETAWWYVYPNPTPGSFTLEFSQTEESQKVEIIIYGIKGEKITHQSLQSTGKHTFSLSGKPAGIYFIRVISETRAETKKMLKE